MKVLQRKSSYRVVYFGWELRQIKSNIGNPQHTLMDWSILSLFGLVIIQILNPLYCQSNLSSKVNNPLISFLIMWYIKTSLIHQLNSFILPLLLQNKERLELIWHKLAFVHDDWLKHLRISNSSYLSKHSNNMCFIQLSLQTFLIYTTKSIHILPSFCQFTT